MSTLFLGSDNVAGASPEILAAIATIGSGSDGPYGHDSDTARATAALRDVFETDLAVFPVVSGTAANAIALASLVRPYQAIACSDCAHILTSECGAPEFFAGGAKLVPLEAPHGRIDPLALEAAIGAARKHGVHQSQIAALSLTQATEWGTVYRADDVAELAAIAHRHGAAVHMDGARFANAIVCEGVSPANATWRAGVDLLSFGATKNGALAAEAILVFDPKLASGIAERRKQSGHLLSKQRLITAQLAAYLEGDLWLRNARHANAMARRLADTLVAHGATLAEPVEANEVFAELPHALAAALDAAEIGFYRWIERPHSVLARFVASFATTEADLRRVEQG